jgi:predicted secreted protein
MGLFKTTIFLLASSLFLSAHALTKKADGGETTVTYQVSSTRQIAQDQIKGVFRLEKADKNSDHLQSEINLEMKSALQLSEKYPNVITSTGRYFVYNDEQNSKFKGSQTISLESFDEKAINEFAGELQKKGFLVDNYNYTLSEKNRRSMDDNMRLDLLDKAMQIATNVIAKGLHKNFIRFSQIDFNSQNYSPMNFVRAIGVNSSVNNSTNPTAQAGLADVQMSANIVAIFGK